MSEMKILIILPNWLGDAVMSTPAIELLTSLYKNASFTFLGSFASTEILKYHPLCKEVIIDNTKKEFSRLYATYKLAKELGEFSLIVNFRNQIYSSLLARFTNTVIVISRKSWHSQILLSHSIKTKKNTHLVEQYCEIALGNVYDKNINIGNLKIYIDKKSFKNPTLGINAGATYGSAKRWYPEKFAKVASEFSSQYDIIIFGGVSEIDMANEIEENLKKRNIKNYINLAGKTSIYELCENIAGCSLFITNDSGPMHIAASYQIPTIAIFGPTKDTETSQWMNKKSKIVRFDIECSPCMKRECPLKHHDCMKNITPEDVIDKIKEL